MSERIAIVGAGAAGAGVAYALRETDASVTVLEKSRGVCGRAASRRKNDCVYDHGANYVSPDDERVADLIGSELDTEGLVDIDAPVWTFDSEGEIEEGRDDGGHKWTYEEGITGLAKRLFDRTDAEIRTETRIEAIERDTDDSEEGWQPIDSEGTSQGTYDRVVLTPPAPQTASLLEASDLDENLRADLVSDIEAVSYRTQLTAVLHYPLAIERPYYALVNTDHEHEIAWLSREECKRGHVPDGECLLIAQMAPDWSLERYDEPETTVTGAAASLVADLFDEDRFGDPDWTDLQHWRFAIPDERADGDLLDRAAVEKVHFAGDWVAGEGRVGAALATGLETGDGLIAGFD
jgi:renalase